MIKALPYIITFLIALGGTILFTPIAEYLARKYNVLDKPDARKVHKNPTPRWGGIAIAAAAMLAIIMAFIFFDQVRLLLDPRTHKNLTGILIGGFLMVILGMLDDKFSLPAKVKLAGQIIIAVILIKFDVAITFLTIPFIGFVYLPAWVSWALTLVWIVGITNAINLLDGLDGLLAGVSAIFATLFACVSIFTGQYIIALAMVALAGASLGFLKFNFNPARIFMGDTGSLFLGLMFASLSTVGALKITTTFAMFIPALILALPILDTSMAITRRFLAGRPIFSPDKEHVHHQLLAKGYSVREAVLYIYLLCSTLGVIGMTLALVMY